MNKTNLLFLGTTNYGFELSKSDENKFRELNEKFNVYVFTYGTFENEIDFKYVKIKYLLVDQLQQNQQGCQPILPQRRQQLLKVPSHS